MDGKSDKRFNRVKGRWGEAAAAAYLEGSGFKILTTNFSCNIGEIDLIATKNNIVHFIEVKARENNTFGFGREAVTMQKQQKIRKVAKLYLLKENLYNEVNCCFDVMEINGFETNHEIVYLENCF